MRSRRVSGFVTSAGGGPPSALFRLEKFDAALELVRGLPEIGDVVTGRDSFSSDAKVNGRIVPRPVAQDWLFSHEVRDSTLNAERRPEGAYERARSDM
jgi:hypothetical protein